MSSGPRINVINHTRGTELATNASLARTFWTRLVGLLGYASLAPGEGLLIEPCKSVHTAFMRFPINVIFIDKSQRVVKTNPNMKAFRASAALSDAHAVIELPAGVIDRTETSIGDEIRIEEPPPA